MKKIMMMVAMIMVLALALAACSKAVVDEEMPAMSTSEEEMAKDEVMADEEIADEEMADEEMEAGHSEDMEEEEMADGDMDKDDDMTDEDMDKDEEIDAAGMEKEDDMMDDEMEKEEMAEPMMKNDGDPAPTFSLQDLNGNTVALKDLEGEKVYVKYWASWCSICLDGLDELEELAGADNDFKVITIVTPDYKGEKDMADFKEWFGMKATENMTVLLDVDGEYAKEFGIRGFPTSVYIGSDGVLVKTQPGHASNEVVRSNFEAIY